MAKICGYVAAGDASLDLDRLLSDNYSLKHPRDLVVNSYTSGPMNLATARDGGMAKSKDGRFWCAVDGRLFESVRLRTDFKGRGLNVDSMTPAEVLLQVYQTHGPQGFRLLEGGFVFAIMDTRDKVLVLGRDNFGVKTLFYSCTPSGVVFASNLASIATVPWFNKGIGLPGFLEYLACGYVSTPWTIFEHAAALKSGECVTIKEGKAVSYFFHKLEPDTWQFSDTGGMTEEQLADRLDELLIDAVRRRLPHTEKVAAYLSGGLDTSILCATLKQLGKKKVVAYTMGFKGHHDETPYAANVARHLGIEHRPFFLEKEESLDVLRRLPDIYGQPLADISAIPTCVIASKVGEQFDAIYDGQGPDFLFGNFDLRVLYYCHQSIPMFMRSRLSLISQYLTRTVFKKRTSPNLDVSELIRQPEFFWIFTRMFKSRDIEQLVGEPVYAESFWCHRFIESRKDIPLAERLRMAQFLCYGINDVLFKACGAHGASMVDILCPFFDMDIFNFVQFLPTQYKFRGFYGKYLQRKLLYRKIPKPILDRPKRGFIMDFVEFGVDTTRELTDKYLTRNRLNETGLFNADFALQCVENYYRGDTNMGPKLWTLLMFEMWRERFSVNSIA